MPVPPQGVRDEARRGLEWRAAHNRGGTMIGVARARDLARGADISPDTIRRMVSFFARHEVDKRGQGYTPGDPGYPSAGRIAWALWGGDEGRRWAENQITSMRKQMADEIARKPGRLRKLRISRVDRVSAGANPDAHVVLYKREELLENVANDASDVLDYEAPTRADERQPSEEHHMTDEQTTEATTPETIEERLAALEAERDAAIAKIAEMEAAATIVDDETDDADEDDVMKSLDPSVRERIAKAESERAELAERVAKMEDEAMTATFVAKASAFSTIDKDAERLGGILKSVAKNCDTQTVDALETILKSATARLDEANRLITAEIGIAGAIDQTDAGQMIESLAKARALETGETMPVATAAILNDQPHLYEQARAERGL